MSGFSSWTCWQAGRRQRPRVGFYDRLNAVTQMALPPRHYPTSRARCADLVVHRLGTQGRLSPRTLWEKLGFKVMLVVFAIACFAAGVIR